ncbi:uncharacterized protein LOC129599473 [Paramacrobiotus metropolitanus]|uniref:uncharacterized protein LOC129599473 n=1 Tax=Paramacrobiotus metropolitanus TaxID=2943436 RepID=UPI002445C911|nr:uncharacterized protein LOC129599473 [Paramacrobiotus metropolitanus]
MRLTGIILVLCLLFKTYISFPVLELISFLPYNGSNPDVVFSTAAINLTMERLSWLNESTDGISVHFAWLYNASSTTCEEIAGDAVNMVAEHFYEHHKPGRCSALIGSKCGLTDVSPLASEWNVPLFDILVNDKVYLNPADYPTVVIPTDGYNHLVVIIVKLLSIGRWDRACLLFDKSVGSTTATYYWELFRTFIAMDSVIKMERKVVIDVFDYSKEVEINRSLAICRSRNIQAILIISDTNTTIRIMNHAFDLGMGDGDTV